MLSHLVPGARVQDYIVDGIIAVGGTGVVVRVHRIDDRSVHALKFLHLNGSRHVERFLREGRIQTSLRHPNLLRVTDVLRMNNSTDDLALVMDLVNGPTLGAWARRHEPTIDEVDQLAEQLFAGLDHAHRAGVVHRDIKPENVLIERRGDAIHVLISDFGIARLLDASGPVLTGVGQGLGTPNYMAPEQYRDGGHADARADIFALAALLYELLSGSPAFARVDINEAHAAASHGAFVPLDVRRPDVPPRIVAAIHAALRPDPAERPVSIPAFRSLWRADTAPSSGWTRAAIEAAMPRKSSNPPIPLTINVPPARVRRRPLVAFLGLAGIVLVTYLIHLFIPV